MAEFMKDEEGSEAENDIIHKENDEDDMSDEEDQEFNEWVEEDEDVILVFSFFEKNKTFSSIESLMEDHKVHFNFDLKQIVKDICSDVMDYIKLINFIRSRAKELSTADDVSSIANDIYSKQFLKNDQYMIPVLQDDPLLCLYEDIFSELGEDDEDD